MPTETKTQTQLPVSTNAQNFSVNGQAYEVLRFEVGKGPSFSQSIELSKNMGEMLTYTEAREIRDNAESNKAFKAALKPGEWGYVSDQSLERMSRAAYLVHSTFGYIVANITGETNDHAPVLILKVTSPDAAASQSQASETLLRPTEAKE